MADKTPADAAADLKNRAKGFNDELIPLLGKYKLGLGATPFLTPDGRIAARPQVFDDSKQPEAKPEAEPKAEAVTEA